MDSSLQPTHQDLTKSSSFSFKQWMKIPIDESPPSTRSQNTSLVQCLAPRVHVTEFWEEGTRPDGRLFSQGRATQVVFGMLKHSAGSALVSQKDDEGKSGGTKILAATSFNIGQPSPDQPDEGEVVVQVSGTGGRNTGADSKSHQQQHQWDTLQSWLQRTLEQDKDMAQSLSLLTGKACLRLIITVMVLEDRGNIKDGALLACMAAWKDTRLPQIGKGLTEVHGKLWIKKATEPISSVVRNHQIDLEQGTEKNEGKTHQRNYRISLTSGVWFHPKEQKLYILTDPSDYEEPFLQGTITVIVGIWNDKLQVDYTGKVPLTAKDIAFAVKLTRARAQEVTTLLS
mmetsp:Transcript_14426/g.33570  ORF Transcript_14426/g.33570 Transcript_14426/m.33570 type:complete len:342 (-) Transcript_14426:1611-2636(-)